MLPVINLPAEQLVRLGLRVSDTIHYQLAPDELIRHCLRRKEGVLNDTGALMIRTGSFTGRSPKDRYLVKDLSLDPATCGTRGPNAVAISFRHKLILVAGTGYTGEIKKGVFTKVYSPQAGKRAGYFSSHPPGRTGRECEILPRN